MEQKTSNLGAMWTLKFSFYRNKEVDFRLIEFFFLLSSVLLFSLKVRELKLISNSSLCDILQVIYQLLDVKKQINLFRQW